MGGPWIAPLAIKPYRADSPIRPVPQVIPVRNGKPLPVDQIAVQPASRYHLVHLAARRDPLMGLAGRKVLLFGAGFSRDIPAALAAGDPLLPLSMGCLPETGAAQDAQEVVHLLASTLPDRAP